MLYSFATVSLFIPLLQSGAQGFKVSSKGGSRGHAEITVRAILETTLQVCRDVANHEGRDFTPPARRPTAVSVARACSLSGSKGFISAITHITQSNWNVDYDHMDNAEYHFDNEMFEEGRQLITVGLSVVKASISRNNFWTARRTLGAILHTLQDFYSHSNWIELNNRSPHSSLIRQGISIGKIADKATPTCRSCVDDNCRDNILKNILREKILTTGYFSHWTFSSEKPDGKCSHGGFFDGSSRRDPKGGINKDDLGASHGHLHIAAANVAMAATSELLEDVREAAGDIDFLWLMGISRRSKALCFVIDTTGSMRDDIAEVKRVTSFIIDSKRGTADEPSLYILVPFNDPDFGPLTVTRSPDVFKALIKALNPTGGGDLAEMSLSGLQLALTGAPPSSEIFLFTDAAAKDSVLKSTVIALIERTKSVVNCLMTGELGGLHRRRCDCKSDQLTSWMTSLDVQLYKDLCHASGGQAIHVTKTQLTQATSIIIDSTSSSQVTILQAVSSPGKAHSFPFAVDESVRNLTVYIIGSSLSFTVTNPSGVSQNSLEVNGLLGSIQTVGDFYTVRLKSEVGLWEIRMNSDQPCTLKVIGQSDIDFLFDFVEVSPGPHGAFSVLETRPKAGGNGTLLVCVTGSDSMSAMEVVLVEASGAEEVHGTVEPRGGRDFMVTMDRIPEGEFMVRLRGVANSNRNRISRASTNMFQRQSSTHLRASTVTVTARSNSVLVSGTPFSVPFTVSTKGTGGTFTIRATNDRGFTSSSPASLVLATAGSAIGTVNFTVPIDTPSGSDVTLTIEAASPGGTDTNYAVLRLSIVAKVEDVSPPVFQVISVTGNCSTDCSLSKWELSANLTDGSGTGIHRITLRQGNGILVTSTVVGTGGEKVTQVAYSASCCFPDVELVAVDGEGNVGTCFRSVRPKIDTTNQKPFADVTTVTDDGSVTNLANVTSSVPVTNTTPTSLCLTVGGAFVMLLLGW